MGYAVFKVKMQGDTVGNRLKEVQQGVQDLATFGSLRAVSLVRAQC